MIVFHELSWVHLSQYKVQGGAHEGKSSFHVSSEFRIMMVIDQKSQIKYHRNVIELECVFIRTGCIIMANINQRVTA